MLGAIFTGLSGLNAFSAGLQTISNNVTNLNTLGYKATSTTFSDVFTYGGGGLTFYDNKGSASLGNGVRFDATRVDFAQGDLRQTSGNLDLAIQGSGFLVLNNNGKTYYTRTGQFAVDKDGYISLQSDTQSRLAVLDGSGKAVALNIDAQRTSKPTPTTTIKFADNLSSTATTDSIADVAVYDSMGGKHTWTIKFDKVSGSASDWGVTVTDDTGATVGTSTLKFSGSTVDPTTQTLTINSSPSGADPLSVVLDFSSGVTSFSAGTTSTLRTSSVDGNAVGALTTVTIDAQGHVVLNYSNSQTQTLGAVALADFRDPQQLRRVSGGLFVNDGNGPTRVVASQTEGVGQLLSKQLEASNTNLSEQFGELILIQRGFQASSQVVSATNDMIQQLFGIRGQG
ncbi:MAG: flagellar basal-body rod protein FlgF [Proteobacteria bacterium]|nr:flagellar basal-body rod protein FlgF [Pseudomonadota bacterium]